MQAVSSFSRTSSDEVLFSVFELNGDQILGRGEGVEDGAHLRGSGVAQLEPLDHLHTAGIYNINYLTEI